MAQGNANQVTVSFNEARRDLIKQLVEEKYKDEKVSPAFIDAETDDIVAKLENDKPLLVPREQSSLTKAEDVNSELEEYYFDINAIYAQLDHMGNTIKEHQKLNESILNDVKTKVAEADHKLEVAREKINDISAHKVVIENFLDANNAEEDGSFYTDRDGTLLLKTKHLYIDPNQQSMKLPLIHTDNGLVNSSGVKLASIRIANQVGAGFITERNPEHCIDKAIDTSNETFWNETILTDEPLTVDMGLEYYGVNFGAVCAVEILFDYATTINEVTLMPFSEYPMQLVAVHAYTNDEDEEFDLISPQSYLTDNESTGIISYQFQDVSCKKVVLILNQQHYVKRNILYDLNGKDLTDAWLKAQGHFDFKEVDIFKPVYQNQLEKTPQLFALKDYMKKNDIQKELNKVATPEVPMKKLLSKYEYQYGLYNLALNNNEYFYEGAFVTNVLAQGNIHIARLQTEEINQILENAGVASTSIEYYLTDSNKPDPEDWNAILPEGQKEIRGEKLFFDFDYTVYNKYRAESRFDQKELIAVMMNGAPLKPYSDYITYGRSIILQQYDTSAIYTIDYIPEENAYTLDFLKKYTNANGRVVPNISIEDFEGTDDNGLIQLKNTPFKDKQKLNNQPLTWIPTYLSNSYIPIKVQIVLPDGTQLNQKVSSLDISGKVENRTDYFDPLLNMLEPFDGVHYQYRVTDNQIKFNTAVPKGSRITVEYPYLTGPIRMKIIMRRNLYSIKGLTPNLNKYKAIFQSLQ